VKAASLQRDLEAVRSRLWRGALALVGLLVAASAGYRALMHWPWAQCLYFTVITITTVGYNDYNLSEQGKLLTVGLLVLGLALWTFVLAHAVEWFILGWQRWRQRQMERDLESLARHFIVVGYGMVGAEVARWLQRAGRAVLVVDLKPAAVEAARAAGFVALAGDATEEDTLLRAGLQRAAGLMAVTRSDPVNVFVTLTARGLCATLHICGAALGPGAETKLRRAGADAVVSPYDLGAQRLATAAISPHVAELMAGYGYGDEAALVMREAVLEAESPVCGKRLRDAGLRESTGVLVAALKEGASGKLAISPDPDYLLGAGDVLIGFGLFPNMCRFVALVGPRAARETAALTAGG